MPLDEQTACIPYDAKWEFPKERLRLGMYIVLYSTFHQNITSVEWGREPGGPL